MGAFLFLKLFFALALTIGFANVRMLTNFVSSASDNESFHVNGSFFVLGKFQKDSLKKPLSKTEGLLNYYFLN